MKRLNFFGTDKKSVTIHDVSYTTDMVFDNESNAYFLTELSPCSHKNRCGLFKLDNQGNAQLLAEVFDEEIMKNPPIFFRDKIAFFVKENGCGKIICCSLNGSIISEYEIDKNVNSMSIDNDGNFIVTAHDNDRNTYAISVSASGMKNWEITRMTSFAQPIISKNRVYMFDSDSKIIICDFKGCIVNTVNIGIEGIGLIKIIYDPENETAYIVNCQKRKITAIDERGNILRQLELPISNSFFGGYSMNLNCAFEKNAFAICDYRKLFSMNLVENTVFSEFQLPFPCTVLPAYDNNGNVAVICDKSRNYSSLMLFSEKLELIKSKSVKGESNCIKFDRKGNLIISTYERAKDECNIWIYSK